MKHLVTTTLPKTASFLSPSSAHNRYFYLRNKTTNNMISYKQVHSRVKQVQSCNKSAS